MPHVPNCISESWEAFNAAKRSNRLLIIAVILFLIGYAAKEFGAGFIADRLLLPAGLIFLAAGPVSAILGFLTEKRAWS